MEKGRKRASCAAGGGGLDLEENWQICPMQSSC